MNINVFGLFSFGIIDVVIVGLVITFIILGWKNGFLERIIKMASSIFGLVASLLLAKPFSAVLDGWFGESIETNIRDYLLSRDASFATALTEQGLRESLETLSLPDFMVDWIVESIDFNALTTSVIDSLVPLIQSLALLVIAFILLFFGSMIVFFLLRLLAKGITSIPVIKQIDKILGVLFGILKVALLVYGLLFVLALLINIPSINNLIYSFLETDMQLGTDAFRLSKYLYDNNLLKDIINVFVTII